METEIGPTLREARIRRKIDLTEIEDRTKIRVRYLRALETEEWDLLPGATYTRSFIRTYANFLGLDGERLADDFRRMQEDRMLDHPGAREPHPPIPAQLGGAAGGGGPRFSPGVVGALVAAALVAVIVVLGVTGNNSSNNTSPGASAKGGKAGHKHHGGGVKAKPGVSIQLTATAEVWVCAVAADGTRVVNGAILPSGTQEGPFRSSKFDLAFGNGGVDLKVDGKPFKVENTPSPVGYEVTESGTRLLQPGTRPQCT